MNRSAGRQLNDEKEKTAKGKKETLNSILKLNLLKKDIENDPVGDLKFFVTSNSRKSRLSQSARSSRQLNENTGSRLRLAETTSRQKREKRTLS